MKNCTKCGDLKPLEDFRRDSRSKDGRASRCKACARDYNRQYYEKNREKIIARAREWDKKHPERAKERYKAWAEKNREYARKKRRDYYSKNKSKIDKRNAEWKEKNRDIVNASKEKYRKNNREKCNNASNKWVKENWHRRLENQRKHRKQNPEYWAIRALLARVIDAMRTSKKMSTERVLGYGPDLLRQRMECQFKPGMSWENHGEWHIDHKMPVSHFLAKGETRPHIINALANLQPLWATENQRKNATHPLEWKAETQEKGQGAV